MAIREVKGRKRPFVVYWDNLIHSVITEGIKVG